jgi:UDP-N-acetylmuramate--alanine ligase
MDEFARSFNQADAVYVLDVYGASEKPIEGVTADALAARMREFGHRNAQYTGTMEDAVAAVLSEAKKGDVVMTLGAGNVWQTGDKVLQQLKGAGNGA